MFVAALDQVLRVARPRKSLVLALDGAAPIAKIVTQRWPDPGTSKIDLGFPRTR